MIIETGIITRNEKFTSDNRIEYIMKLQRLRTRLIITLFLCESIYSFGQQGLSLKLYQNTDIYQVQCTFFKTGEVTKQRITNFSRISLAFVLPSKKRYLHEVEFLIPEFSKPLEKLDFPLNYNFWKGSNLDGTGSTFSFRYELSKPLSDKSNPIEFLLGAGINPYYVHLAYEPRPQLSFYRSLKMYGVTLNIIPRISYKFSQLFSIDLNAPIRIYSFRIEANRIDDPILPSRQQRFTETKHLFFEPVYTIRLGLMYSLTKINR